MSVASALGLRAPINRQLPASRAAVVKWFQAIGIDPWYRDANPIPLKRLAKAIGVSRRTLNYARRGAVTQRIADRIAPYIEDIENGRLVLTRGRVHWFAQPARRPQPQPPLVPEDDWTPWSLCRSCGAYRWRAVAISGKPHAACYCCLPPAQWPSIGAVGRDARLLPLEANERIE